MAFFSFLAGILRYSFRVNEYPTTTTTTKKKAGFSSEETQTNAALNGGSTRRPWLGEVAVRTAIWGRGSECLNMAFVFTEV